MCWHHDRTTVRLTGVFLIVCGWAELRGSEELDTSHLYTLVRRTFTAGSRISPASFLIRDALELENLHESPSDGIQKLAKFSLRWRNYDLLRNNNNNGLDFPDTQSGHTWVVFFESSCKQQNGNIQDESCLEDPQLRSSSGAVTPSVGHPPPPPPLWPLIWVTAVAATGVGSAPEHRTCLCREIKGPVSIHKLSCILHEEDTVKEASWFRKKQN